MENSIYNSGDLLMGAIDFYHSFLLKGHKSQLTEQSECTQFKSFITCIDKKKNSEKLHHVILR